MSVESEQLPSAGDWVRDLPELLERVGYWDEERYDEYDSRLEAAVAAFQSDRGLTADGVPRGPTWAALAEAAPGERFNREIDWAASFPEIYQLATAESLDEWLRRTVEIDPAVFEDGRGSGAVR